MLVGLVFMDHFELRMVRCDFNTGFGFCLFIQTVLMRTELLLLDTEQVQSHGNREQNRGEHEQNLFLRLKIRPKKVCVQSRPPRA